MSLLNANFYYHSNAIHYSLRNYGHFCKTKITKQKTKESIKFKTSFGVINVETMISNPLDEMPFASKGLLIEQFNMLTLMKMMKQKTEEEISKAKSNHDPKQFSTHVVQTGGVVQYMGKIIVLDEGSVFGTKKSLFVKNKCLFELTKPRLNKPDELNKIGEQI